MKILVIGQGGREAAMVHALVGGGKLDEVICAPGNAGIAQEADCVPHQPTDIKELVAFARHERIGLTIVGPEAPLVAGIVDEFRAAGLPICGPTKLAAQMTEGSKAEFKKLLARHDIATPHFEIFSDRLEALEYIRRRGVTNIVIKADGLLGGKGVKLPNTLKEAEHELKDLMVKGTAGETVVIEDRLVGVERSAMAVTDGETTYMLPFTKDYKRVGNNDTGPNTGGMGAHTIELPESDAAELTGIMDDVLDALKEEGCPYTGFLYLGFMMTENGPMILEANCRLGDPETQAILSSIDVDFFDLCARAASGTLSSMPAPPTMERHALCLVLASEKYPTGKSERDDPISGLTIAAEDALVLHAGTARREDGKYTTGYAGRVLNLVGCGPSLIDAHGAAYAAAAQVSFPRMQYRRDIGISDLNEPVTLRKSA